MKPTQKQVAFLSKHHIDASDFDRNKATQEIKTLLEKFKTMKTRTVKLTRPGSNPVRDSDRRIADAIQTLEHRRGQQVISDLARLFKGPASGLDLTGMSALVCLVREFAMGSRREFLPAINADKAFTIREQDTTGDAFVLGFDGEKVVYTSYPEFAKQFSQAEAERFIDKYQGNGHGLNVAMIEAST